MLLNVTQSVQLMIADDTAIGIPDGHVVLTPISACEKTQAVLPFCFVGEEQDIQQLDIANLNAVVNLELHNLGWQQTAVLVTAGNYVKQ